MKLDAIVIGGSCSGLSAALRLARARRQIAVVDAGQRRNRFASTSHGFLGQDGRAAQAIVDEARAQLLAYPNVRWLSGTAEIAEKRAEDEFVVMTSSETLHAKRLVLATGVVDDLIERSVDIETAPVNRLSGNATVELADGRKLEMHGLFTTISTRMASTAAEQLGCAFDDGPTGPFIRRSEFMQTTVAGVFACGDAARMFGSVAISVGDGALAGAAAHRLMISGL